MIKTKLMVGFLVLIAFAAGWRLGGGGSTVEAQGVREYFIDQSWGQLKGSLGNTLLLFEDPEGTVRIVQANQPDPMTKMLRLQLVLERK